MDQEFQITTTHAGKRLDVVALALLPGVSRSKVQKMIREEAIKVNAKKVAVHHFLKAGDIITVRDGASISGTALPLSSSARPFRLIFECDDYLVIEKPAGLVVHGSALARGETLVDQILKKYPEIRTVGDDPMRPGIVHRLDKDASGVMVIARTQSSFESLARQFKLRQVKKEYHILAYGHVQPAEGMIDLPIARSRQQYTRRAAGTGAGRPSVTRYVLERYIGPTSLVLVQPETGRTHQIRVHFFAKGNPIVGDSVYVSKKIKKIPAGRLMLHAEVLGFRDLSGEWREYTTPPDEDFGKVLEFVRGAQGFGALSGSFSH
jgi:23S rRNA pseudouridine1911/1915/1917 synthase